MKSFDQYSALEEEVNKLYSFYNTNKRVTSLHTFATNHGTQAYMLNQVFDVRWVSSHKLALEQIFKQFTLLVKHLMYVSNDVAEFGRKAVNKALSHLEFFGSRSI